MARFWGSGWPRKEPTEPKAPKEKELEKPTMNTKQPRGRLGRRRQMEVQVFTSEPDEEDDMQNGGSNILDRLAGRKIYDGQSARSEQTSPDLCSDEHRWQEINIILDNAP